MESIKDFVDACEYNDLGKVKKMISDGVDINGEVGIIGVTGLWMAMHEGNTEVVAFLLSRENIRIDTTSLYTALHWACDSNHVECLKLLLKHPTCTKDFVRKKNIEGLTAEEIAERKHYQECVRLIREYLEESDTASDGNYDESKEGNLSATEIVKRMEELNDDEIKNVKKMKYDHEEELNKLEEDYKKELNKLKLEYHKYRDETIEKHANQIKQFCSEIKGTKRALGEELDRLLGRATPPSPNSLLPTCPVCFETMQPPLRIFSCPNGHLICSSCKPRVSCCYCQTKYMGRASAME